MLRASKNVPIWIHPEDESPSMLTWMYKYNGFELMLDKSIVLDYLKKNVSDNDILLIKGSNSSITNTI